MHSFAINHIVAFPIEEEPRPVSSTRRTTGVALCCLGVALCGAGLLFAATTDWLPGFGATLGLAGLFCFSPVRLGAERDPRKLYGGTADLLVRHENGRKS